MGVAWGDLPDFDPHFAAPNRWGWRVRRLFTTAEARAGGLTREKVRRAAQAGWIRALGGGVYGAGPDAPSALDLARAAVLRCGGEARGRLAGVLHDLDGVRLGGRPTRRDRLAPERVLPVGGVRCADGLATLVDLAATLDDLVWEQALEAALRKRLTTVVAIEQALPGLGAARVPGVARIRRVLALRPRGAPATGSLLETLFVQLVREVPGVPEPARQVEVRNGHGDFIAFVDFAWPELGVFIELDGQQHQGQPVYDAHRQTAVAVATGWLCGRFTWHEVTVLRVTTARNVAELLRARRPLEAQSS
jgi:hypothetical protein